MSTVSGDQVKAIAKQTFKDARERDLPGMAQQIAYNFLFALGPLLIFMTAFAGFVTQKVNSGSQNPVRPVTDWMNENLPGEAATFLREPVEHALTTSPGFLLSFGALLTLWGAKNAMAALIKGLNQALAVEESRPWVKKEAVAIGLTIALAAFVVVASLFYVLGTGLGDDLAGAIGLGAAWSTVSVWLRWPIIAAVIVLAVTLLHYFAPNHSAPFRWYLPGAILTVILWVISLLGLRIYFAVSGSFAEAYGVFGAVLAFVFWLYVMALVVLIGGVVNSAVQERLPAAREDIAAHTNAHESHDAAT